jgi:hypothetical protein
MVVSLFVGQAITRTGRYKMFPVIGGAVMTLAMFLLSRQGVHTSKFETGIFIAVLGLGMGFLMQTTMLIAQNSVERKDLGVASSSAMFFRSIGGSFGVSLFGAVFNHELAAQLRERLGAAAGTVTGGRTDPSAIRGLPADVREALLGGISSGISQVFAWAIGFAVLIPVLALLLKEVPLRGSHPGESTPSQAQEIHAQDAEESPGIASAATS